MSLAKRVSRWMRNSEPPHQLGARDFGFADPRLPELLFRYRARNWPDSLSAAERERWDGYRRRRLLDDAGLGEASHPQFLAEIAALRAAHAGDGGKVALLDQLEAWGAERVRGLGEPAPA